MEVREFADKALQNMMDAHGSIIESRVTQKHYADKRRSEEPSLKIDSLVYLSTRNLSLPRGRASKLLLRKHHPNNDALFPMRSMTEPYDFGEPSNVEWLVDEITGHHWDGRKLLFHIKWNLGDTTTEPYNSCKDLTALDRYLELQGVSDWWKLPQEH